MKVKIFDSQSGIYRFELDEVNTQQHAHPAIELLFSAEGQLTIETEKSKHSHVCFAIIAANLPHRVYSAGGAIDLMMVECHSSVFQEQLNSFGIVLQEGLFTENIKSDKVQLMKDLSALYAQQAVQKSLDSRVTTCLSYLDEGLVDYKEMIAELKAQVNLSESRLSHLFKSEVGVSLKKYLVWSRLKKALQSVVNDEINLYEAALQSGFFDQAHLSKTFKQMLGLSPSQVYNSRMIQE